MSFWDRFNSFSGPGGVACHILRDLLFYWKSVIVIFVPLVLLPLLIPWTRAGACSYVVLVMAIFWMTEALPLAVTSLFPIFLFPIFAVMDVKATCAEYLKDSNFLFVGGILVALGVEETNLHKRIALGALMLVGSSPAWQMLGFMVVTCFLSMWLSNTATTALMLPIAKAVCDGILKHRHNVDSDPDKTQLETFQPIASGNANGYKLEGVHRPDMLEADLSLDNNTLGITNLKPGDNLLTPENFAQLAKPDRKLVKGMVLSICYAANIGGTGALTGTVPNIIAEANLNEFAQNNGNGTSPISYANWMFFAVPGMVLCVILSWIWLQILWFGFAELKRTFSCHRKQPEKDGTSSSSSTVQTVLRNQYQNLGSMSFGERSVFIFFLILVVLWIFRSPKFIDGWESLFDHKTYIKDTCAAIAIACLLFAWPIEVPDFLCFKTRDPNEGPKRRRAILTWKVVHDKFPWDVILLLGGGFAMAKGVKESGLSDEIGEFLRSAFGSLPPAAICCVSVLIVTFLTEFASNTATATIFVPVLLALATKLEPPVNPLYLVLPVSIAASFAFMLPVSTPPNAIVYGTGLVSIPEMMASGLVLNFVCMAVTLVGTHTWTWALFNLGNFPNWAIIPNVISSVTEATVP